MRQDSRIDSHDNRPSPERSRNMASVPSKNTSIELKVRSGLFARGFRYRVNDSRLPGRPDLVLAKYKAVVFVNGCFWHLHGCKRSALPKTRTDWWSHKLRRNKERDEAAISQLLQKGWRVLTIWECSIRTGKTKEKSTMKQVLDLASVFLHSDEQRMEIPLLPQYIAGK